MIETRKITKNDLDDLAEIERLCFAEPWSKQSLELLLKDGNFALCALFDGRVAAYVGVIAALPDADISNVASHPDFRRKGLADALLCHLKLEAAKRFIDSIYLEVRRSNTPAQMLYQKQGFAVIGERKGFYKNPKEDAILMRLTAENGA